MSISRRKFLVGSAIAGGGLVIGFSLKEAPPWPGAREGSFAPNAWLQITPQGQTIFHLHKAEMGQGVLTSLTTLLAEELDLDPAKFDIEMAGVHPDYGTPIQLTGASTSISSSWEPLRKAGASARAMLMMAGAKRWSVSIEDCSTNDGHVVNAITNESLSYAELAEEAKSVGDVPYALKAPDTYRWIGRSVPQLDTLAKTTGQTVFGIDKTLPGLKTAVVVRCPYYGGSIGSWQRDSVISLKGVLDVFAIHSGIAVVADNYWLARKAADALVVTWEKGPLEGLDSAKILSQQKAALGEELKDADALPEAAFAIEGQYSIPYAHHTTMEPQNATALFSSDVNDGSMEIWAPNQSPDIARSLAAHFGNVAHENIAMHTTLMGGGFGRRGYPDFVGEVAAIAREMENVPIKLIWSREDDIRHDYFRPATLHTLKASVDEQGAITGWQHYIVAPSLLRGMAVDMMSIMLPTWVPTAVARSLGKKAGGLLAGSDYTVTEGSGELYGIENKTVTAIDHDPGIPIGFWRSVGFSHNTFAVESFMDELAHQSGEDPLTFRLRYLADEPRAQAVLKQAAEKADWGKPASGLSQGLAVAQPLTSYCGMVVEVEVTGETYRVHRVVVVADCGRVINPAIVKAQLEGAIVYGLTAALKQEVTIADGRAVQSNFHDLPVLRIDEMPVIDAYFVESTESPTGIGEISLPTVAPALANALFAATGKRLRSQPLRLGQRTEEMPG